MPYRTKCETLFGRSNVFVRTTTDALLSHKGTKFSTMGFRALFNLVFVSLGLTTLQLVLAFHVITTNHGNAPLYSAVLCVSIVNLSLSIVVRKWPRPQSNNCRPFSSQDTLTEAKNTPPVSNA